MNRQGKIGFGLLLSAVAYLLVAVIGASAAPNIKEKGILEAVGEGGRTVTISTQGDNVDKVVREHRGVYQLSSLVIILNEKGKRTTLDAFPLPVKVEFDVEYTPAGALIKKIRVIPQ
ncbi:MAG: hypothetical protein AABZ15_14335 [Nitrospirota bacterium]